MSSSLSRAFTTRRAKLGLDTKDSSKKDFLNRSASSKVPSIIRPKISGPVQLVHTTNMLSYNAPDIEASSRRLPSSSHSSLKSDEDSLVSPYSVGSSPPTSPESSICERPTTPEMFDIVSPGPKSPLRHQTSVKEINPPVPRRAPSHTKKASLEASRIRSSSGTFTQSPVTRSSNSFVPPSPNRSLSTKPSQTFSRSSANMNPPVRKLSIPETPYEMRFGNEVNTPFGQELAQVAELAEDYGLRHKLEVIDEEERQLNARGLYKHSPESYARDVSAVRIWFFPETVVPNGGARPAQAWI